MERILFPMFFTAALQLQREDGREKERKPQGLSESRQGRATLVRGRYINLNYAQILAQLR